MQIAPDITVIGLSFRNGFNWREARSSRVLLGDTRRDSGHASQAFLGDASYRLPSFRNTAITDVGDIEFTAIALNSGLYEITRDQAEMPLQSLTYRHNCEARSLFETLRTTSETRPNQNTTRRLQ